MRYHISLCMLLSTSLSMFADEPVAVDLCPGGIAIIDGIFINGELIGQIFKIASNIQAMQLGKRTQQGRVGIYMLEGKPHTIKSLVVIEKDIHETLNKSISNNERLAVEKRQTALKSLLETMKQDLSNALSSYLALARGAKSVMVLLISQSCEARNRQESELLSWANTEGDEMGAFKRSINSFEGFDAFCSDLVNFLGDLVHSCPKARAQFEKLKKDYMRKQAAK